jgi:hypothetical protein
MADGLHFGLSINLKPPSQHRPGRCPGPGAVDPGAPGQSLPSASFALWDKVLLVHVFISVNQMRRSTKVLTFCAHLGKGCASSKKSSGFSKMRTFRKGCAPSKEVRTFGKASASGAGFEIVRFVDAFIVTWADG